MAAATQQANAAAMLVATFHESPQLAAALQDNLPGSPAALTVVLPDGHLVGAPWPDLASDPSYESARQGQAFTMLGPSGGQVYVPVLVDDGVTVVRAVMTPDQLSEGVPVAWLSIIALGLALSGVAVFVAAQVGRGVSRPLLAVADTAHRLRQGELGARAPLAGPPETVELGSALNGLADRIDHLLAAERDSVRGLAHRLRTPVTALRLEVEQVQDQDVRAELGESIVRLQVAIDEVVREARRPLREDLPVDCDARAVVNARLDYWRPLAEDQQRTVTATLPERRLPVGISALELGDVIDICIDNVFAHTEEATAFAVSLEQVGDQAVLVISDRGAGFAESPSLPRPGTSGMGLHLARRSVQSAGGTLETSPLGQPGAEVRISIPLAAGGTGCRGGLIAVSQQAPRRLTDRTGTLVPPSDPRSPRWRCSRRLHRRCPPGHRPPRGHATRSRCRACRPGGGTRWASPRGRPCSWSSRCGSPAVASRR